MSARPLRARRPGLSGLEQLVLISVGALAASAAPRLSWVAAAPNHHDQAATAPRPSGAPSSPPAPSCGPGLLADDQHCVPLPAPVSLDEEDEAPASQEQPGAHVDRRGRYRTYDQIPRRPDRPADYDRYVYPIPPGLPGGQSVVSGYDLDRPDTQQRRGRMRAVGHGGVDLPQKRGTPVRMIRLEHQIGEASVIHTGPLMGLSVVTLHRLREGGRERAYVLIFGHLDGFPPEVSPGKALGEGDIVGFVGDTGSPELVHLHLEARRLREGVDGATLTPHRILADDVSVVCDPRNVLPLKAN